MADERHAERYNAVKRYSACTLAAARKLAWKNEPPDALARKALRACRAEERALTGLLPLGGRERLRLTTMQERTDTIRAIREARTEPEPTLCASCGMRPAWDPQLKVWRPYGQ